MFTWANISTGAVSSIWTTAIQLSSSQKTTSGVYIKADSTNTAPVYIGNSTVTRWTADATDWFPINASEWVFIEIDNPSLIYVISSGTGQKVYFQFIF